MSTRGRVESIHVTETAGEPMRTLDEVRAIGGQGLEGDRYCLGQGTYSDMTGPRRQVTLIEREVLEAIERDHEIALAPAETRRNIVTRGVALTHLVGTTFKVGEVVLRGIKINEPCRYFENLVEIPGLEDALMHRSGLNAEVIGEGLIRVGDAIEPTEDNQDSTR